MWQYVMLILCSIAVQYLKIRDNRILLTTSGKNTVTSMRLFWLLLLILLMIRNEAVGVDLPVYEYIYEYIASSDWKGALGRSPEIAWSFINKVITVLGGNFRWVIVVTSFLSTFWISRAYVKYSTDGALTISLFLVMSNFVLLFSGLRQSIAISLGFWAFEFVRKKKLLPFVIITLVAISFHTSGFMIFFMYPLYYLKFRKKELIFIIPALLIIWVFNQPIFTFLGLILNQFTDYDTSIVKTGSVTMLILFVIFGVFSYLIPRESELDPVTDGMRNYLIMAIALQMFAPLHTLAMRMNYYYMAFIPVLIPRIIECRSRRMSQVAIAARHVMVLFFIVYFFTKVASDNVLQTFPYKFLWKNP